MYDQLTGDVYIGEYTDGKRVGHGRMLYAEKQEIYDGDWSNDRRQGEGIILNGRGEIVSGDFRADHMEGKLTYKKTLSAKETESIFSLMLSTNDIFIAVNKTNFSLQGLQTKQERSAAKFQTMRKTTVK